MVDRFCLIRTIKTQNLFGCDSVYRLARLILPLTVLSAAITRPLQEARAEQSQCGRETAQRVENYLKPLVEAGEVSGTLLLAQGPCIILEKSYGLSDRQRQIPNRPSTLFAIASITKPLTDIILDRLVEQHRLALSDSLYRWLPDFPRARDITVEELRSHRAGIPHRVTTLTEELEPHSATDMVRLAEKRPLLFEPGKEVSYSSAGYSVLARVLEIASGRSYADLLREFVFDPARVTRSLDATQTPASGLKAVSYFRGPTGLVPAPRRNLSFLVGAGSVYSTPADLFRILRALVDGAYGAPERDSVLTHRGVAWTGITSSYAAFVAYDVKTDRTVIFTSNIYTGALPLLQQNIPRIMGGDTAPVAHAPHVRAVPISREVQKRLEGSYAAGPHQAALLHFISPTLVEIGEAHLIPTSDTSFFAPESYSEVSVGFSPDGTVDRLEWRYAGSTYIQHRVQVAPVH